METNFLNMNKRIWLLIISLLIGTQFFNCKKKSHFIIDNTHFLTDKNQPFKGLSVGISNDSFSIAIKRLIFNNQLKVNKGMKIQYGYYDNVLLELKLLPLLDGDSLVMYEFMPLLTEFQNTKYNSEWNDFTIHQSQEDENYLNIVKEIIQKIEKKITKTYGKPTIKNEKHTVWKADDFFVVLENKKITFSIYAIDKRAFLFGKRRVSYPQLTFQEKRLLMK